MASIKRVETKNGISYKITVSMGRTLTDKQIRHYMTWKPDKPMTEKQMEKKVKEIAYEFEKSLSFGYQVDNRQTFAEYAEYVYHLREVRGDAPQTLARVRRQTERINQYIGRIRLTEIRPGHINALYDALLAPGGNTWNRFCYPTVDFNQFLCGRGYNGLAEKCGTYGKLIERVCTGKPITRANAEKLEKALGRGGLFRVEGTDRKISYKTLRDYHGIVYTVLAQAEKEMIVPYNAAGKATLPPNKGVRDTASLTKKELTEVIEALEQEPFDFKMIVMLLISTGCRRGEIMALSENNINFDTCEITIDKSLNYLKGQGVYFGGTKTGNTRVIKVPREIIEMLVDYLEWEKGYFSTSPVGLIFKRRDGSPRNPTTINVELSEFCKRHDLPHINPHKFRHTFASLLISGGLDVVTVSGLLGHATTETTLKTYTHATEENIDKATDYISSVVLSKSPLIIRKSVI